MDMPAPLDELCELLARVGISNATKLQQRFERSLTDGGGSELAPESRNTLFLAFLFMNWAIANGAWSNLTNPRLRQDLMATSVRVFSHQSAYLLSLSPLQADVAYLATTIDEQLRTFARNYTRRAGEMEAEGIPTEARSALLYALEFIQSTLDLPDAVMSSIVPRFLQESEDFAEVESVAFQTNRAAMQRSKLGFWARFVDGWKRGQDG
jgi:hypothetical protein